MNLIKNLCIPPGLLASGTAFAHGMHAEAPANSLLHLLAHNWPLLLGIVALVGLYRVLHRPD